MGVTRCCSSNWRAAGTAARRSERWLWKIPASRARDRKVLSTPKSTSARGLSLVRIAWLSMAPASPARRMLTVAPLAAVKPSSTSSEMANESCVIRTSSTAGTVVVVGAAVVVVVVVVAGSASAQALTTTASRGAATQRRPRRLRIPVDMALCSCSLGGDPEPRLRALPPPALSGAGSNGRRPTASLSARCLPSSRVVVIVPECRRSRHGRRDLAHHEGSTGLPEQPRLRGR